MVDHSVMEKLHDMKDKFRQNSLKMEVIGLRSHRSLSEHPLSTRKRGFELIKRIILFTDSALQPLIEKELIYHDVSDFTTIRCGGTGVVTRQRLRIEILTQPNKVDHLLDFIRGEILPKYAEKYSVRAYIENVEAILPSEPDIIKIMHKSLLNNLAIP